MAPIDPTSRPMSPAIPAAPPPGALEGGVSPELTTPTGPHAHSTPAERREVALDVSQLAQAYQQMLAESAHQATDGLESGGGTSATAPTARMNERTAGFSARIGAANTLAAGADAEAAIAAFLAIANDTSLTPAERAEAFVGAGRSALAASDGTRAELFYLRAIGLKADADTTIPGARVLHLNVLANQNRLSDMLPLVDAEIAAQSPVTDANRDLVVRMHRTRSSILQASARLTEARSAIEEAIRLERAGGAAEFSPTVIHLNIRRAEVLRRLGAQMREADPNATGADDTGGRALQRESTAALQRIWHHLRDFPGDISDANTLRILLAQVHGALDERVSPLFSGDVRQPGRGVTRANILTIETKFREAQALYNRATARPAGEAGDARRELRDVQRLAEEILALDDNDGLAHFMWRAAFSAEQDIGTPLIAPIDTPAEQRQVLDHLMTLAGRANISVPGAPAPQPRAGQGEAAIRRLFPEWDQLSEQQRSIIAYEILGYGDMIPSVIEAGANYHFVGIGTSAALVDPRTTPDEFDDEDRAFYAGRGWARAEPTGHFIVTGTEDILSGGRGGYPTVSHEFAHLIHGTMRRATAEVARLRAAGSPVPANLQALADSAAGIEREFQRVQDDRDRVFFYEVEQALAATPPRPVPAASQAAHDRFLTAFRAANGAGATPPAQPSPPLDRFLNSYSARNSSEYFAEAMMSVLVGGNEDWSRELFTRNPSMWRFARNFADTHRDFPAGFAHQLDHPPVGLDAQGRPTTLADLRSTARQPQVATAARSALDHLQALHNPEHTPVAPAILATRSVTIGDPDRVSHAASRRLIADARAGNFGPAEATAREILEAARAGRLSDAELTDALTALTLARTAAEGKANWSAGDVFLQILLTLLGLIPGIIHLAVRLHGRSAAVGLRDLLRQTPLADRNQAAWAGEGLAYARRGGVALANFRATHDRVQLRQHIVTGLRAAGVSDAQLQAAADAMLAGIAEADRGGAAAAPDPHPEPLDAAERARQTAILLRRAGELSEMNVGSRNLASLGDHVLSSGTPPVHTWDHSASDASIRVMGFAELAAQVELELLDVDRQLAATPAPAAARRGVLDAAKTALLRERTQLRDERVAFYGNDAASPPLGPTRPPEDIRAALEARRVGLQHLHREVLGPPLP